MKQQRRPPPLIFCASAPSDRTFLAQWETHLLPLMQARQITVWSERHLMAGATRLQQINDHLDQAQVIVFLISAEFFASDECAALTERALTSKAHVIPLLLSPVDWKTSKLSDLACLPSNGVFVTNWENQADAFHTCVQDLRQLIGLPEVLPQTRQPTPPSALENQNRVRMLRRLRRSYNELMSQSLQGTAWLELGMTEKPDAVQNAANLLLRIKSSAEQPLPPGTSIMEAYDEAGHELLILGEPGAGKSTLLLDLAQQLVVRAEQDQTHPLPVILPLSSWAVKRPPIQDWIAGQLVEIYNVPRKLSAQWVEEDSILPLLDGLDEMEEMARPACIAAINTYHRDHMAQLVVCSRTTEHEAAAKHNRLALQGAIIVQPLTHERVDTYLVQAGRPLAALRSTLKKNGALRDLATTPLMLNILILTYQGTPVRGLSNRESLLLQQVWNDYVQRMVARKGNSERYPLEQTRSFLRWLAQQMRDHNLAVFYLEHLQPSWLPIRKQRSYTWLAIRLPGVLIGVLTILIVALFLDFPQAFGTTTITGLIHHCILGGFLGGLFSERITSEGIISGALPQTMQSHSHHSLAAKRIATSIFIGLVYGLGFGLSLSPDTYELCDWLRDGSISAIMAGLSCWFLLSLSFPQWTLIAPQHTARFWQHFLGLIQSLIQTLYRQHSFLVTAVVGGARVLSQAVSDGFSDGLNTGLDTLLTLGLASVLVYGISSVLILLMLAKQATGVQPIDHLKWTLGSLLRGLVTRTHLGTTILLTLSTTILFGLSRGLIRVLNQVLGVGQVKGLSAGIDYLFSKGPSMGWITGSNSGVIYGVTCGLAYWLLLGLLQSVKSEFIDDKDRSAPNQGIRDSARNSFRIGVISAILVGMSLCLGIILSYVLFMWSKGGRSPGLSYTLTEAQAALWGKGWLIVCCACGSGLLIGTVNGGLAVLRHAILRILLWRTHIFLWRAPQFLNDATARFFLQRVGVGGGCRFTHQVLRDHFADPNLAPPSAP